MKKDKTLIVIISGITTIVLLTGSFPKEKGIGQSSKLMNMRNIAMISKESISSARPGMEATIKDWDKLLDKIGIKMKG